jgi:hypothetical protein
MIYAYENINGVITLYEVEEDGTATEIEFDQDIYERILFDRKASESD